MKIDMLYSIALAFLLFILYLQIAKKNASITSTIRKIVYNSIANSHNKNTRFHLNLHLIHFKKREYAKKLFGSIISTLILAFIFYNYIFFAVPISDSMSPTFEKGDLILMQKYDIEPYEGDIVMFGVSILGEGNKVVTHRVYSVTPDGIKTKGDATSSVDNWKIPKERIHAKAISINDKPIVIKSIGHYFLDTQVSSTYASEFRFMQSIVQGGKQLGLLIFVICLVAYTWLSVNDMKKQKKYRRRN